MSDSTLERKKSKSMRESRKHKHSRLSLQPKNKDTPTLTVTTSWSRGAAARAFHDGSLSDNDLENITNLDEISEKLELSDERSDGGTSDEEQKKRSSIRRQNSSFMRKSFGKLRNLTPSSSSDNMSAEDYAMLKEKCKKLAQEELKLLQRLEELKEKERELLESCSRLSSLNGSTSILRMKPKDKKILKVDSRIIHIRERLGAGASGAVVYSCLVDGWVCAMKKLTSENKIEIDSFEREMAILYKLPHHPNIVKYLFHTTIKGKMCLFMTKHTSTLQKAIHEKNENGKVFTENQVRSIASHIIQGIAFLHKNQIIHRDIKTENVYCTPTSTGELDEVVVADFDTAKRTGVANTPQSTIGTLGYMAPEVFNSKIHATGYDFSADIFSFGMVLYSLISLKEPFDNIGNPFLIYEKLQNGFLPEFTETQLATFSPKLIKLQRDCIQLTPGLRPPTPYILEELQGEEHRGSLVTSDSYSSLKMSF